MNAQVNAFSHIVQQMADNASFLWVLRGRQRREPHVFAEHIQALDARIQANLDGLLLYGDDAWAIATANGEFPQGGEAFCLGYLAFSGEDVGKIQYATEFALQNDETFKGLVSALAWLPGAKVHPWVTQFFHSKNLAHKRLALATCRVREEDPAGFLNTIFEREDCVNHPALLAEALRTAGFFKRRDLLQTIPGFLTHADAQVCFWAIYCCARLGQSEAAKQLKPFCIPADENLAHLAPRALLTAMLSLPVDTARLWIGEWIEQGFLRTAVQACGFLGDSSALTWLGEQMANPELNRIATEAFFLITGHQSSQASASVHIETEDVENLDDDSLHWGDSTHYKELLSTGNLTSANNFKTQLKLGSLKQPYQAMKYQRMAQWLMA